MSDDINAQANAALDFLEKLNFEMSYLIKDVEGRLKEEPEEFVIGRGSGYAVSTSRSSGLDYAHLWNMKNMSVFFVPSQYSSTKGGYTVTSFIDGLQAIYLLLDLKDPEIDMPMIYLGTMYDISIKNDKYCKKLEHLLQPTHLWKYSKIYDHDVGDVITFDSEWESYKLKCSVKKPLFAIENSELVEKYLIKPSLRDFRKLASR